MTEKKNPRHIIPNKQPICPQCGSKNVVARLSTQTYVCRRCMCVGNREEFFKVQDSYEDIKGEE